MNQHICQSCGMPMDAPQARYGTEKDGSLNPDYCSWCYNNGAFLGQLTMEEMIDFCLPFNMQALPHLPQQQVLDAMRRLFPTLKRWKGADGK